MLGGVDLFAADGGSTIEGDMDTERVSQLVACCRCSWRQSRHDTARENAKVMSRVLDRFDKCVPGPLRRCPVLVRVKCCMVLVATAC